MKHLSIAYNFTIHQKTHLVYVSIILFGGLYFILDTIGPVSDVQIIVLIITIIILYICLAFSKKGIGQNNEQLFKVYYIFGKPILKTKVPMNLKTDYSILSYRKTQKLAFFSAARPDLASSNYYFDIHILNTKHTVKDLLISIKKESHKDAVINFLEKNTSLSHNIYSPDFS